MPRHPLRLAAVLAFALAIGPVLSPAHAEVYKCTDAKGRTTYSDTACDAAAKPLKLPEDPKANATNPNACVQLHDEMGRLAAEAERNAQRGQVESASSLKRRQGLTRQYESRCMGISRTAPTAK